MIKKSFIFLIVIFSFSVQSLSKQSAAEAAVGLFSQWTLVPLKTINQESLDYLFKKITLKCAQEQCKEAEMLDCLIALCDAKLYYYNNLITKKENNYISILCKLGIPLLMSVFLYIVYKIPPKDNTQEIELIEKKLKSLGATMVLTGMGNASAWCKKSNPNEVEIRKELQHLANLSPCSTPEPTPDLALILITTGVFLLGINDLLDQIYASFYYEKYCFIKEALNKQITSIPNT